MAVGANEARSRRANGKCERLLVSIIDPAHSPRSEDLLLFGGRGFTVHLDKMPVRKVEGGVVRVGNVAAHEMPLSDCRVEDTNVDPSRLLDLEDLPGIVCAYVDDEG